MAFAFDRDGDTVKLVFHPGNFETEQSTDIATGTDLLVQVDSKGKYPVWVTDNSGDDRAGVPCFPGVPVVVTNPPGSLFVFSGDGDAVVYITPGALTA